MKFGRLDLLEPTGPVQACNGIALPFYPYLYVFSPLFSLLASVISFTYVSFLVQVLFTLSVH